MQIKVFLSVDRSVLFQLILFSSLFMQFHPIKLIYHVEPDETGFILFDTLPGQYAFCCWELWISVHYSCENLVEKIQGATTSSHILPPLLEVQLLHM